MRVNCPYDDRQAWVTMAENLKRAKRELGKNCQLSTDLAGPKLRVAGCDSLINFLAAKPEISNKDEADTD